MLQNIALQYLIKKLGAEPETIINYHESTLFYREYRIKQRIKELINYKGAYSIGKRRRRFQECAKKHIKYSKAYWDGKKIIGDISGYHKIIAGSDQLWNPGFNLATDFELVSFVAPEKRASYAASIGIASFVGIDDKKIKFMARELSKMADVSVREIEGQKLLTELGITQSRVDLDPTLLLQASEWDKLIYKPKQAPNKPYIVVYMLGTIPKEYMDEITRLSKKYNAELIDLLSDRYKTIDPLEFVWLIKYAECICTDSFHATVFSILYHKCFYVLNREDGHLCQNSRFNTLFEKCGIDTRIYNIGEQLLPKNINWNVVDFSTKTERESSLNYLKSLLS